MAKRPDEPADSSSLPTFAAIGYDQWREAAGTSLETPPFDTGFDLEPLCTARHPARPEPSTGVIRRANPERGWVVCQHYTAAPLDNLNHYLKDDLGNGVTGVRVGGAGPGYMAGLVRALGDDASAWRLLMLDAGDGYLDVGNALFEWVEGAGIEPGARTLMLGADSLAAAVAQEAEAPIAELVAGMASLMQRAPQAECQAKVLTVSTEASREAGADLVQELAVALAVGAHYLRKLERAGVALEVAAAQVAFATATGQQIFLEIGKLRALRWLWQSLLMLCGLEAPPPPWVHATVLRRSLVESRQSDNHLRATTATTAAAIGGADSIEIPGNTLAQPGTGDDDGRVLGRNTQHVLDLEAHLAQVQDPAAGSYLLETLTLQLAEHAWSLFRQIEAQGGISKAYRTGWIQDRIAESRRQREKRIAEGEIQIMGLNVYGEDGEG